MTDSQTLHTLRINPQHPRKGRRYPTTKCSSAEGCFVVHRLPSSRRWETPSAPPTDSGRASRSRGAEWPAIDCSGQFCLQPLQLSIPLGLVFLRRVPVPLDQLHELLRGLFSRSGLFLLRIPILFRSSKLRLEGLRLIQGLLLYGVNGCQEGGGP
jgi:hypothetical protein